MCTRIALPQGLIITRVVALLSGASVQATTLMAFSFTSNVSTSGLDAAFAALPAMYAFFPMIALQSGSPGDHLGASLEKRKLRDYVLRTRFRDLLLARLMRPSEWLVAVLSPLFRSLAILPRRRQSEATS